MAEKQKERIQFDFSSESLHQLDNIKKITGATTRAEVVRNALRAYDWIVSELDPDYTIEVLDKNKEKVTSFKAKLLVK